MGLGARAGLALERVAAGTEDLGQDPVILQAAEMARALARAGSGAPSIRWHLLR